MTARKSPSKTGLKPPPKSRETMRAVDKAFIHSVMFELGILPIEDPSFDMRRPQSTLTKEEARVLTRKFRKLWRKYMRQQVSGGKASDGKLKAVNREFGVGKLTVAKRERLARKRLVYESIWAEYIAPMIQRFENPTRADDEEKPA